MLGVLVDVNLPGNRTISRNGQISPPLSQNLENRKKSDGIGLYGGGQRNALAHQSSLMVRFGNIFSGSKSYVEGWTKSRVFDCKYFFLSFEQFHSEDHVLVVVELNTFNTILERKVAS